MHVVRHLVRQIVTFARDLAKDVARVQNRRISFASRQLMHADLPTRHLPFARNAGLLLLPPPHAFVHSLTILRDAVLIA